MGAAPAELSDARDWAAYPYPKDTAAGNPVRKSIDSHYVLQQGSLLSPISAGRSGERKMRRNREAASVFPVLPPLPEFQDFDVQSGKMPLRERVCVCWAFVDREFGKDLVA